MLIGSEYEDGGYVSLAFLYYFLISVLQCNAIATMGDGSGEGCQNNVLCIACRHDYKGERKLRVSNTLFYQSVRKVSNIPRSIVPTSHINMQKSPLDHSVFIKVCKILLISIYISSFYAQKIIGKTRTISWLDSLGRDSWFRVDACSVSLNSFPYETPLQNHFCTEWSPRGWPQIGLSVSRYRGLWLSRLGGWTRTAIWFDELLNDRRTRS